MADVPITQILMTVQFDPPAVSLNILDLAALRERFSEKFPVFNQVAPAGPMTYRIENLTSVNIQAAPALPRLQLLTEDMSRQIMFQYDRISFGWNRISSLRDDAGYPGYETIFSEFMDIVRTVRDFANEKDAPHLRPIVGELTYTDAFYTDNSDGSPKRLSSIFNVLNPLFHMQNSAFSTSWNNVLSGNGPEGFIQVVVSGGQKAIDGSNVAVLQTTGDFNLSDMSWDEISSAYNFVHKEIGDLFEKLVSPVLRTKFVK